MSKELWRLSAVETAAGIREKKFSSESVVESVNKRITHLNPQLNAIVDSYGEEAMAEARLADQSIARGESIGLLHGVPVTIKSNIDVIGKPTPNGLPAFRDNIAPADSPGVRILRKAGAILLHNVPATIITSDWRGLARGIMPKRSIS